MWVLNRNFATSCLFHDESVTGVVRLLKIEIVASFYNNVILLLLNMNNKTDFELFFLKRT